jgi:hypothetical protein
MKLAQLSVLSAAALLAGGLSIAAAQSSMAPNNANSNAPGASAASQGKCWDAATNGERPKAGWRRDHRRRHLRQCGQQHRLAAADPSVRNVELLIGLSSFENAPGSQIPVRFVWR